MSTAPRFLGLGVVLGVAAGLLAGVAVAAPSRAADPMPSATPSAPYIAPPGSGPAALPSGAPVEFPSGTVDSPPAAGSGTAIAYPYFGGAPGIAPDHTIVVTGVGQAELKADGSDRAVAQQRALQAALADARAQADVIAAATGLTITGVLSVSASVWPDYGILPMAGSNAPTTGGPTPPQVMPEPVLPQTLGVSVTVAYSVS